MVTEYNFQGNIVFVSLEIDYVLANSADPGGIWVFAVCQSTCLLEVFSLQRVNVDPYISMGT